MDRRILAILINLILLVVLFLIIIYYREKDKIKYVGINKDSVGPFGLLHKRLEIGDRLVIFAGYDYKPKYLGENNFYIGEIIKFIPGHAGRKSAIVLKMNEPIQYDSILGQYFILKTRHEGQDWKRYGPVHVELCDFVPDGLDYEIRKKGVEIEGAASYEFEERYFINKNKN